jgi:alpha-N-acetylglucosamine transferase
MNLDKLIKNNMSVKEFNLTEYTKCITVDPDWIYNQNDDEIRDEDYKTTSEEEEATNDEEERSETLTTDVSLSLDDAEEEEIILHFSNSMRLLFKYLKKYDQ